MPDFKPLNLKRVTVDINDLVLDPNNPRFSKHVNELTPDNRIEDKDVQAETLKKMAENFDVDELEKSIRSKGFTPVDNIFVKKLDGKYLVIEGNRRITAIKMLLLKNAEARRASDAVPAEIITTLNKIDCYDLGDNDDDEIDFILGLRHHGSIKQWSFLPASFNIYKRYMKDLCEEKACDFTEENFEYKVGVAKKIADLYSLKPGDVRDKLRTYRAYLQLIALKPTADHDHKFSIIGDAIKNTTLRKHFEFDEISCTFSEEGAEKFLDLVYGDAEREPVIIGAAAGEGNLRDLAYVIEHGNLEEDVQHRIYELREDPANVKADIRSKLNERTLLAALKTARAELEKIRLGSIQSLAEAEKDELEELQKILDKLKRLVN